MVRATLRAVRCSSFVCSASSSIAVIAGDRIGREVVPGGLRVLEAAASWYGIELAFTTLEWADCDNWLEHGQMMPAD